MTKHRIIGLLICLLAVASVLYAKYHPGTVPVKECSRIYRDFAADPHVSAAFIKDFRVNDTIQVNVTTLKALDSIGWEHMLQYFGYTGDIMKVYKNIEAQMNDSQSSVSSFVGFCVDKDDCGKRLPPSDRNSRRVIGSYKDRTFSFYHTDRPEIKNSIFTNELKTLKN